MITDLTFHRPGSQSGKNVALRYQVNENNRDDRQHNVRGHHAPIGLILTEKVINRQRHGPVFGSNTIMEEEMRSKSRADSTWRQLPERGQQWENNIEEQL
jgi:hypothetical protein